MSNILILSAFLVGIAADLSLAQVPRNTTINKYRNLISDFLTFAQVGKVVDGMALDMCNLKTVAEIGTHLRDTCLSSLSAGQLTEGTAVFNRIANDLGGEDKAMAVVNILFDVINNNFSPLIIQIEDTVKTMKANGRTQAAILCQEHYMTAEFMTFTRAQTILGRFKARLTAAQWTTTFKNLGTITWLSKYFTS
ncbi:hypothetical protein AAVH_15020 [Aphelenchoides avenae]|nr:hypothetical protein AAVH_26382 [Aphelenchus avenae]KAH7717538.1 hypothetical protein AAVH_15020 [Aphelenchus avenae]